MRSLQMMRRLSSLLLGILLILIGVAAVLMLIGKLDLSHVTSAMENTKLFGLIIYWILTGVCIFLGLLWLTATLTLTPKDHLETMTEGGRVLVQTSTAQDFIRECAGEVGGVMEARCNKLTQKSGSIRIEVVIVPTFDEPVHKVAENVQRRVQDEIRRVFGFENVQDVDVRIVSPSKRSSASRKPRKTTPLDDITSGEEEEPKDFM